MIHLRTEIRTTYVVLNSLGKYDKYRAGPWWVPYREGGIYTGTSLYNSNATGIEDE